MEICITFGGHRHCFFVPIFQFPVHWGKPGPGPVNYPALFQDSIILASIRDLARNVNDNKLRDALSHGVETGLSAMQERAGKDVSINLQAQKD